jgi:hypothetical protein
MFLVFGYIVFMVFGFIGYIQYVCGYAPHEGYGGRERTNRLVQHFVPCGGGSVLRDV